MCVCVCVCIICVYVCVLCVMSRGVGQDYLGVIFANVGLRTACMHFVVDLL